MSESYKHFSGLISLWSLRRSTFRNTIWGPWIKKRAQVGQFLSLRWHFLLYIFCQLFYVFYLLLRVRNGSIWRLWKRSIKHRHRGLSLLDMQIVNVWHEFFFLKLRGFPGANEEYRGSAHAILSCRDGTWDWMLCETEWSSHYHSAVRLSPGGEAWDPHNRWGRQLSVWSGGAHTSPLSSPQLQVHTHKHIQLNQDFGFKISFS